MNHHKSTSIKSDPSIIHCPSCGDDIDVEGVIVRQAELRLRREFNDKFTTLKNKVAEDQAALERERLEVKKLSAQTWEIIQEKLRKERIKLAGDLRKEATQKAEADMLALQKNLEKQQAENLALRRREMEVLNREKKLSSELERQKLQLERTYFQRQTEAEKEFRNQYYSREEMLKQEYEKKLGDQRRLIEEMNRKIEQGSMQMQGEVQEIVLESYLNQQFVYDHIESIKQGARGADCLQHVQTPDGDHCGIIYYESKRTKSFQPAWIEKFKADMRHRKADIGILVTQSMPKDLNSMAQLSGIWVCTFEEVKVLAPILREGLIKVQEVRRFQKQSGDKMNVLYDYLTSNEFRMQVEGIVEGFICMQDELGKEKRAMQSIWKRREKQIEKVLLNTNHMYSSIRGIAGEEVQQIGALELADDEITDMKEK